MAEIIDLPPNIIGKDDHQALESFCAHEIARGRLTRYHWDHKANDDPLLKLYRGGIHEELAFTISRKRSKDHFRVNDAKGKTLFTGDLDHVMKVLDQKLTREHDESDTPA
jgi:hypothetical protein